MEVKYFFDSYAVIEIIKGSSSYSKYKDAPVVISFLNLVEVMYAVFKEFGEKRARQVYNKFLSCVHDVDENVLISALQLKQKYSKKCLSYADCIGYAFALENGYQFLTGDKEFVNLPFVELVKNTPK